MNVIMTNGSDKQLKKFTREVYKTDAENAAGEIEIGKILKYMKNMKNIEYEENEENEE